MPHPSPPPLPTEPAEFGARLHQLAAELRQLGAPLADLAAPELRPVHLSGPLVLRELLSAAHTLEAWAADLPRP